MKKEVLLFAGPKEIAGRDRLTVNIDEGATYEDLREQLRQASPPLAPLLAASRFAANGQFVDDEERISNGDEIALVPPVSGG